MSNDKKTILVVEDEDEIGSHMENGLTRRGYRVIRARDADDAGKLLSQNHLSLILTDLELPTLNLLMDRVRADETHKDMPVVVIDLNHPQNVRPDLTIIKNFDELDELISAQ